MCFRTSSKRCCGDIHPIWKEQQVEQRNWSLHHEVGRLLEQVWIRISVVKWSCWNIVSRWNEDASTG